MKIQKKKIFFFFFWGGGRVGGVRVDVGKFTKKIRGGGGGGGGGVGLKFLSLIF